MKKFALIIICLILSLVLLQPNFVVFAYDGETDNPIIVYTENYNYLFEKSSVEVGDSYITKNYELYEIVSVNYVNKTAIAKFIKNLEKPNIKVNPNRKKVMYGNNKKICLYLTHNDESYVPTDKVDSVYGAGGVHDVAKQLKKEFNNLGIDVTLDETLHIPHDTSAYARSKITATKLLNNHNPDAIFDIHRDGVSRKYYATVYNGEERCKVRIVVGKANPNYQENLEFAMYLLSVAEQDYPWLFSDIYMAKGHYNQGLYNKSLLFEMGTYLIEKELVLDSVEPLTNVISTALYSTTVNDNTGEVVVGGQVTENTPTINDHLNQESGVVDDNLNIASPNKSNNKWFKWVILVLGTLTISTCVILVILYIKYNPDGVNNVSIKNTKTKK